MNARSLARVPWRAPVFGAVLCALLLLLLNAALTPGFFARATLFSVLIQAVTTLLIGAGMTLVVATGGVDLSVGSVMALASAVAVSVLPHGMFSAFSSGLAVGVAFGAVNGVLVARLRILPIIVTL